MPLLGSRLLVRTPIGDFIVRWNLPDGTIRTQAIQIDTGSMSQENLHRALHTEIVSAIAFSEDGQTAVTGGTDGLLRVWDVVLHGKKK